MMVCLIVSWLTLDPLSLIEVALLLHLCLHLHAERPEGASAVLLPQVLHHPGSQPENPSKLQIL